MDVLRETLKIFCFPKPRSFPNSQPENWPEALNLSVNIYRLAKGDGFIRRQFINRTEVMQRHIHMANDIILASGSDIRRHLLMNAGVSFHVVPARIDEEGIKQSLLVERAPPRDIADTLAEMKARKVAEKHPSSLVIGCDQILAFEGDIISKPSSPEEAIAQLQRMRGKTHQLISAAVVFDDARPVWRKVDTVRMSMRGFSDAYLTDYVARNWDSIRHSVGAYKLEEEGVRLFTDIQGNYFSVLGLPLLDLLNYLTIRGDLPQ